MNTVTLLEKIEFPADIKELSLEELEQLCSELREYIVSCCAANPGHIGASLGVVEIAVALHRVFDTPNDKIVWDVGHQAYAHKILTGRREAFKTNRKLGGISGFPKRSESEYDAFGTGHSSTSISAALGLAVGAQMQGSKDHFVAVIGDGSMTAGLAFEGLNNAGSLKTNLLVILNDNQISIDKGIGALHNHLIKVTTSRKYNRIKKSIWDRLAYSIQWSSLSFSDSAEFIHILALHYQTHAFLGFVTYNLFG
jgi:1-deoxy-D-xylulose-5-phosphate synthase